MSKLNILHLDFDSPDNLYGGGGQAKSTFNIYKRLSQYVSVTVVTGNYPKRNFINTEGINYHSIGVGFMGSTFSILTYWILLPFYVFLNQKKYDLVFEYFTAPFSVSLVPLVVNKPFLACPTFFDSEVLAKKYRLPFDLFLVPLMRKYKNFVVMSNYLKTRVLSFNRNANIHVIPRGVEDEYFKTQSLYGDYAIYFGRIDLLNKGIDLLIQSWSMIKDQSLKLIIVGSGKSTDEQILQKMIRNLHLSDRVTLLGKIVGQDKIDLISKAKFVVNPSRFETFGNTALESLAMGKVLICFDIPGYAWIDDNVVIKVKDVSVESLRNAIERCVAIEDGSNIGMRAREFAKRYTWDNVANSHLQLFKNLIV